jgi:hypothetical protein
MVSLTKPLIERFTSGKHGDDRTGSRTSQILGVTVLYWLFLVRSAALAASSTVSFVPLEDTNAVLHNPDMGWVVYENYPIDPTPGGSSTLVTMPGDSFPEVSAAALMFSWADVETAEDNYDFSNVDFSYDYWKKFGTEIQLRMSTEPLMLHVPGKPLAGTGVPPYVLDRLSEKEKEVRDMGGEKYLCVDARNPYYQKRLKAFLKAVDKHFDATRPVTVIDLRGFGAWGEWHSGFHYPSLEERRDALKQLLDSWTDTLPKRTLALSFSYDPDSPKAYYGGPNDKFDPAYTTNYNDFLQFSGFDYALTKKNITWRRDGCGGAVHSNERKLIDEAFLTRHQAPVVCEFLGSYSAMKQGGSNWVTFSVKDALSLHPNYLNLLGWQAGEARYFSKDRPDLVALGNREMGYRLVPAKVEVSMTKESATINAVWENHGRGRPLRDFEVSFALALTSEAGSGDFRAFSKPQRLNTSKWLKGVQYPSKQTLIVGQPASRGEPLSLFVKMQDTETGKAIKLPLHEAAQSWFIVGEIERATRAKRSVIKQD